MKKQDSTSVLLRKESKQMDPNSQPVLPSVISALPSDMAPADCSPIDGKKRSASAGENVCEESAPKKPRRAARLLLNLNKSPKAMKVITTGNDAAPFFRLPKEIRDQIYRLILADRNLSIEMDRKTKRAFIVRSLAESTQEPTPIPLTIGFLRTSRRIYQEACLLPYSGNMFTFTLVEPFNHFMNALMPAQLREITRIRVRILMFSISSKNRHEIKISTAKALTSLRHIHVDLVMIYSARFIKSARNYFLKHHALPRKRESASLQALCRCPLKTANILVRFETPRRLPPAGSRVVNWRWSDQEEKQLARRIELELLQEWDEDLYQKEQTVRRARKLRAKKALVTRLRGDPKHAELVKKMEVEICRSENWEVKLRASREKKKATQRDDE